MSIEQGLNSRRESDKKVESQQWFQKLIQPDEDGATPPPLNRRTSSSNYKTWPRYIIPPKIRAVD